MLMPKRTKFRKMHRGRNKGFSTRGASLNQGDFGLQATTMGNINSRQIEAARRVLTHHMRRRGQVWIRIFPDKPITRKPVETRMGGGKGAVDHWVAVIKPGRMLFEISGVPQDLAEEAMRLASHKLSVATRFVSRSEEMVIG